MTRPDYWIIDLERRALLKRKEPGPDINVVMIGVLFR